MLLPVRAFLLSYFLRCDMNFSVKRMSSRPLSKCLNTDKSIARPRQTYSDKRSNNNNKNSTTAVRTSGSFLLRTILSTVEVKDEDVLHNLASDLPLVSVMAATTTRRVQNPSPSNMALFMYLLPSLVRSLDCGYRYEYVLGYDKGDPFYDTVEVWTPRDMQTVMILCCAVLYHSILSIGTNFYCYCSRYGSFSHTLMCTPHPSTRQGMMTVHKWFLENVQQPMMENGIRVSLKPVKVNNTIKKPGPVFLGQCKKLREWLAVATRQIER